MCFTISVQAQRGVRIGYIDMEYILESVPEYQEASTQLEGKVQRWKKDIEKMNNEIEQMIARERKMNLVVFIIAGCYLENIVPKIKIAAQ